MAKDRKIDLVILGLLFHEDLTGYDIKQKRYWVAGNYDLFLSVSDTHVGNCPVDTAVCPFNMPV